MKRAEVLVLATILLLAVCACGTPATEEQSPSEPELGYQDYYDLGIHYLSEGNYEEDIIAFTAAIEIEPKRTEAYVGRAEAYVKSGETADNLEAAQADYETAVGLDNMIEEAYLGLAYVYDL